MNREIERKFLFDVKNWTGQPLRSEILEQGYLPDTGSWEARLRRSGTDYRYTMKTGVGLARGEWEIKLSAEDFNEVWPKTEGLRILKVREYFSWKGRTIEVDHYGGALEGLTVAEVEFDDVSSAKEFPLPRAFGPELTYDPRFKNRSLANGEDGIPRQSPGKDVSLWSFGAVPYRKRPGGWEILVVSTRRQDRWIFPKGQPEPGLTPRKVALIEAREEAGVTGKIAGHPIVLPYVREAGTTNLLLYPVQITNLSDRWLESGQRERKLVPLEEADQWGEPIKSGARWMRDLLR